MTFLRHSIIPCLVCLVSLALALAYAVYDYGGVLPLSWNVCLATVGLVVPLYFLLTPRSEVAPRLRGPLRWALAAFPCYVAFQLLPLPVGLLRVVSPSRAELLDAVSRVIPGSSFSPLSIFPEATFAHLLRISAYAAVFLVMREMSWRLRGSRWILAGVLIVIAAGEGGYGIAQYASLGNAANGTYVNRNHYAGLLEMIFPFALLYPFRLLYGRAGVGRTTLAALSMISAAVILLGLICSFSRMGFVSCLSSVLALAGIELYRTGFFKLRSGLMVGLLMITLLLGLLFLAPEALVERFSKTGMDQISRTDRWRETLPFIAAYPVFGAGLGAYESGFLKYKISMPNFTAQFAHNDYLQLLAELGLIGFVIAAVLMTCILGDAMWASLHCTESEDRLLALACAGAITAILVHSLADFNLYIEANATVLAWISGIAGGMATSGELPARRSVPD